MILVYFVFLMLIPMSNGANPEPYQQQNNSKLFVPPFEDNHFAQLLMRGAMGMLQKFQSPPDCLCQCGDSESQAFSASELDRSVSVWGESSQDFLKFQTLYLLIGSVLKDGVIGDFVHVGGGQDEPTALFAAGILKQFHSERDIWLCNEGYYGSDGYTSAELDHHSNAKNMNRMFRSYGLTNRNLRMIGSCFGFLTNSNLSAISILRVGNGLYPSRDILDNLYNKLAYSGRIIIENWSSTEVREAILDFRSANNIHDEVVEIDRITAFWKKAEEVLFDNEAVATISDTHELGLPRAPGTNHINQDLSDPDEQDAIWIPPKCECMERCKCDVELSVKRDEASCEDATWRNMVFPHGLDIAAGIIHASQISKADINVDSPVFEFPVIVISNPVDQDRRSHTELVLRSAGFSGLIFPPFISPGEMDIDEIIKDGYIDLKTIDVLRNTNWVGSRWRIAVSLILNHIHAIEIGISMNCDMFGVFEDDVMLGSSPTNVRLRLAGALAELPPTADVLYLEYCFETCSKLDCSRPYEYILQAVSPACTASMIFTRKGARRVVHRLRRIFLALDNMYAQLIASGEVEAYLSTPPIFFQDSFFSDRSKYGERGAFRLSHRPFSIICAEQKSDLDLSAIHIFSQGDSEAQREHATLQQQKSIFLVSSDSFQECKWKPDSVNEKDLEIHYSTWSRFDSTELESDYVKAGSIKYTAQPVAVKLEIDYSSICWPDVRFCQLFVSLKDARGTVLDSRTVMLQETMLIEEYTYDLSALYPTVIIPALSNDSATQIDLL